jgi:hypothetical protein
MIRLNWCDYTTNGLGVGGESAVRFPSTDEGPNARRWPDTLWGGVHWTYISGVLKSETNRHATQNTLRKNLGFPRRP